MSIWGNSNSNGKKPTWTSLTTLTRGKKPPMNANVFASSLGWMMRRPWGDECIVKIGGLATLLGNAAVLLLAQFPAQANVVNAAAQTLAATISFNKPVVVTGSPTVVAIQAAANVANVTLTYSSTDSDANCGRLVFKNTTVNLATANVGGTFTVNSTSVVASWSGIVDPEQANNAVANGVPAGLTLSIGISAA